MSASSSESATRLPSVDESKLHPGGLGEDVDETVSVPPCNLWSDEPPLESTLHLHQLILLLNCLNWLWKDRTDYFAAGNLTIYYDSEELKTRNFRGPDFFVVLDTENHPRRSWTLWEEGGKYPNIIIELLSDSTAKMDRGQKKELYQNVFRTPEYFWYDPVTQEFEGFQLLSGAYQPLQPTEQGWRWSEQLQLYLGIHNQDLRFFTPDGTLVPTPEEAAETEQQRADAEQQRAEAAEQQQAKLVEKLRELGIDPDTLV